MVFLKLSHSTFFSVSPSASGSTKHLSGPFWAKGILASDDEVPGAPKAAGRYSHQLTVDELMRCLQVAVALEKAALSDEFFVKRKLYPNVDFYSGLIYR